MKSNLPATVFVYRSKADGHIAALYIDDAKAMHGRDDFEHVATLEPRAWIESNFAKVGAGGAARQADGLGAAPTVVPKLTTIMKERDELVTLLDEAIQDISDWGAYAPEYFQEKWNLNGCIEKYKAALAKVGSGKTGEVG